MFFVSILLLKVVFIIFSIGSVTGSSAETTRNDTIKKVTHKINTTECSWKIRGIRCYYGNITMHQFLEASFNHGPYEYGVCTFKFWRLLNITKSSPVDIVGRHSLAIESNSSIYISAPFILDWSPGRNRSDMWLGGFCSSGDGLNKTNGNGPGGGACYGSAGHGGMGIDFERGANEMKYGWRYAFNNSNIELIGGSSGGVRVHGSGFSCGGGAIMISSNTSVTIDSNISTNAYNLITNGSCINGGSGGTIIIKAKTVYVANNASLVSRGAPENKKCGAFSGSGGVIVINGKINGTTPDPHKHTNPLPKSTKNSCGVVVINGLSKDRLPPLYSQKDYGCYSRVKVFNYSILPDYRVRPFNCKSDCEDCGYRYAVLHVKLCACVDFLDDMIQANETKCSLRCFQREHFRCGGGNGTHTFYVVYYDAKISTISNKSSNISTPKSCPRKPTHTFCNYPPRTTSMPSTVTTTSSTSTTPSTSRTSSSSTKSSTSTTSSTSLSSTTSLKSSPSATSSTSPTSSKSTTSSSGFGKSKKLQDLSQVAVTTNNSAKILKELSNLTTEILSPNDLNLSLTIFEKIVEEDAISTKNKTESKLVGELVLNIAENLLNNSVSSWNVLKNEEKRNPEIILKFVEQAAGRLGKSLDGNDTLSLNSTHFGLRIERVDPAQFNNQTVIFNGLEINKHIGSQYTEKDKDEFVFLPASLLEAIQGAGPFNLHFLKYSPHSVLVNARLKNSSAKSVLASNIIAISVSRPLKKELNDKVVLNFPQSKISTKDAKKSCRFLDFEETSDISWSTRGCVVGENKDEGRTACLCNHFTSFAVLTDIQQVPLDKVHIEALNWLTYVGCTISLICLVITLTTFAVLKTLVCDHIWIHCNLIASLALAQLVFVFGIKATEIKVVCKGIAIALQYLYTAAIFWMCIEGIHLYRKVVRVFMKSSVKKYYYIFGWGGPAIVVLISALLRFDGFGNEKACWLSIEKGLIWAFVVPVLVVVLINLIILLMVIRIMLVAVNTIPPNGQNSSIRNGVKGIIFLLPILGLTWVFGVVAVNKAAVVFQYIFTVLNSFQGFFIFLFHCVFNKDVRAAVRKRQQKKTTVQRWSYESSWKSKEQKGSLQTSRISNPCVNKIDVKTLPEPPRSADSVK